MTVLGDLYRSILAHPFVFEHVRPFVIGGLDMSPAYRNLDAGADDVILDVGCGTGDALKYLSAFRAYLGLDTDAAAIAYAKKRFGNRAGVRYEARAATADDIAASAPTVVMLAGLLHHLDDDEAVALLRACAASPTLRRVATQDPVYLPGEFVSNALARADRGKHVRDVEGFVSLVERAGLAVKKREIVRCYPRTGRALYLLLAIERAA